MISPLHRRSQPPHRRAPGQRVQAGAGLGQPPAHLRVQVHQRLLRHAPRHRRLAHAPVHRAEAAHHPVLLVFLAQRLDGAVEPVHLAAHLVHLARQQLVLAAQGAGAHVLALLDEEGDGEGAQEEDDQEEGRNHGAHVLPRHLEGAYALVVVRNEHQRPARSWHASLLCCRRAPPAEGGPDLCK